jgi:hypothetical protein
VFKRRRHTPPAAPGGRQPSVAAEAMGAWVTDVVIVDEDDDETLHVAARDECRRLLRAIAAEAVILQDEAEELLVEIHDREPLSELAPRGGRLVSRFVELGKRLPHAEDAASAWQIAVLRRVFDHHALMLSSSLDLLAVDWRSDRMVEQLEKIDGLGAPAQWLEAIRADLRESGPEVRRRGPGRSP